MIDTSPSLFVHNHRTVDGSTIRYQTASICSPKNIDHGCHTLLDSEAPPTCCWKSLCWRPDNGRIEVFFRPSLTVLLLSGLLPMVILFSFFFWCSPADQPQPSHFSKQCMLRPHPLFGVPSKRYCLRMPGFVSHHWIRFVIRMRHTWLSRFCCFRSSM